MYETNQFIQILQNKIPKLQAVYLFGSSGTKYENIESDLDIAILASSPLEPLLKWDLTMEIGKQIGRDVDIVDLQTASTVFRFEILKSGKRIFCRDKIKTDLFETAAYSMYIHFIEDRQPLVDDIKKRGGKILNG